LATIPVFIQATQSPRPTQGGHRSLGRLMVSVIFSKKRRLRCYDLWHFINQFIKSLGLVHLACFGEQKLCEQLKCRQRPASFMIFRFQWPRRIGYQDGGGQYFFSQLCHKIKQIISVLTHNLILDLSASDVVTKTQRPSRENGS